MLNEKKWNGLTYFTLACQNPVISLSLWYGLQNSSKWGSFYFTFKCYLLHFSCDVMGTVFPEYLELQTTCDLSVILTCIFVYFLLYLFVIYFLIYPVVLINSHFRAENNVDIVLKMCLFLVFNLVVYYAVQKPCQLEIRIKLHLAFSSSSPSRFKSLKQDSSFYPHYLYIYPLYLNPFKRILLISPNITSV